VWWDGRTLHTTPTDGTGILAGTTQRMLFERAAADGWPTAETRASVADLHAAPVVWLIGSVRGPVDVVELDGKPRDRVAEVDTAVRRLAGF
jgi:4-amino-4-deoxychorismate lyase